MKHVKLLIYRIHIAGWSRLILSPVLDFVKQESIVKLFIVHI